MTPTINTNQGYFGISTAAGGFYFGAESSVGGTIFTGSAAYAAVLGTGGGVPLQFFTGGVLRGQFTAAGGLSVAGAVNMSGIANAAGNEILCYDTTGGPVTYENAVAGCVPSAMRLKNPLGSIAPVDAEHALATLHPAVYAYKDAAKFGPQPYVGLYADEVCAMDERLCSRDKEGRVENYDKVGLTAYLVAAIQAQQREIKELKRRIH